MSPKWRFSSWSTLSFIMTKFFFIKRLTGSVEAYMRPSMRRWQTDVTLMWFDIIKKTEWIYRYIYISMKRRLLFYCSKLMTDSLKRKGGKRRKGADRFSSYPLSLVSIHTSIFSWLILFYFSGFRYVRYSHPSSQHFNPRTKFTPSTICE